MGTKRASRNTALALDRSSLQPAENLRTKWKQIIKKQPPAARYAWLGSKEGITALGAKGAENVRRTLEKQDRMLTQQLCSQALMHAWSCEGIPPHGLKIVDITLSRKDDGRRKYSVRLVRAVAKVRYGNEGGGADHLPEADVGNRRWTPPQAVAVEDELDLLDTLEALIYDHPSSPSAEAIRMIGLRKGRERMKYEPNDHIIELAQGTGDDRRLKTTSTLAPYRS